MENCGRFVKWSRNLEFSGFGCGDLSSELYSLFTDMSIFKGECALYLLIFFNGSRESSYFLLLPTDENFF